MYITVDHTKSMEANIWPFPLNKASKVNPCKRVFRDRVSKRSGDTKPGDSGVTDCFMVGLDESIEVSFFGLRDVTNLKPAYIVIVSIKPGDRCMPGFAPRLKVEIWKNHHVGFERLDQIPIIPR